MTSRGPPPLFQLARRPGHRAAVRSSALAPPRAAAPCSLARQALGLRSPKGECGALGPRAGPNFSWARRRRRGRKKRDPEGRVREQPMEELGRGARGVGSGCGRLREPRPALPGRGVGGPSEVPTPRPAVQRAKSLPHWRAGPQGSPAPSVGAPPPPRPAFPGIPKLR